MKKVRIAALLLAGLLVMSSLCGCETKSSQKAAEYKKLGITQMESGDYESAVSSFQKALDLCMGRISAQEIDISYYKAQALFALGDVESAIEVYTALINYDAKNWEVYYLRGVAYLADKENDAALADFAKATSLEKNDMELCANIYEYLLAYGLEESGQEYLDVVLNTQASTGEEYYYVGKMYYLLENYDSAKMNLVAATEAGCDDALLLLGCVYLQNDSAKEAIETFTAYLEMYPDSADAMKYMIIAYEYSGDFESAYALAKEYLASYSDEEVERELEFLTTRVAKEEN